MKKYILIQKYYQTQNLFDPWVLHFSVASIVIWRISYWWGHGTSLPLTFCLKQCLMAGSHMEVYLASIQELWQGHWSAMALPTWPTVWGVLLDVECDCWLNIRMDFYNDMFLWRCAVMLVPMSYVFYDVSKGFNIINLLWHFYNLQLSLMLVLSLPYQGVFLTISAK